MVAEIESLSGLSDTEAPQSPDSMSMNGSNRGMMNGPEDGQFGMPPHASLFCSRKQREFTPDSKKDDTYWDRRRRNNAAAKRSREKRRLNDMLLEKRVIQLARENHILRAQVQAVQQSYGIRAEALIDMDQVMATLPSEDQLLNMTCNPNSGRRGLPSPPPLPATMINLPGHSTPPPTLPPHPMGGVAPNGSALDEVYRQCLNATQSSLTGGIKHSDAGTSSRALFYGGPPPHKRPCPPPSFADESRTPSSGSAEASSEDALNLTCNSRSRSSSDTDNCNMISDSVSATSEEEVHHMPHKMRLKYQQLHEEAAHDKY